MFIYLLNKIENKLSLAENFIKKLKIEGEEHKNAQRDNSHFDLGPCKKSASAKKLWS